jgi:prevent-host-death family protein
LKHWCRRRALGEPARYDAATRSAALAASDSSGHAVTSVAKTELGAPFGFDPAIKMAMFMTMKTRSIAELKAQAPKIIRAVEEGEACLITRRNRPVARLTACGAKKNRTRIGFDASVKVRGDITSPALGADEWGGLWPG